MVFRYVLEELTEQQLLDIDRHEQVANTSVTRYELSADGACALVGFNGVDHLAAEADEATSPRSPMPPAALTPRWSPPQVLRGWPLPEPTGGKNSRGSILVIGGSTETLGAVAAGRRGGAARGRRQAAGGDGGVGRAARGHRAARGAGARRCRRPRRAPSAPTAADASATSPRRPTPSSSARAWPTRGDRRASASGCCPHLRGPGRARRARAGRVTADAGCLHHLDGPGRAHAEPDRARDRAARRPGRARRRPGRRRPASSPAGPGPPSAWAGRPRGSPRPTAGCGATTAAARGWASPAPATCAPGSPPGCWPAAPSPTQAAVWAAYLHGRAGERLAATVGRLGFLARELPPEIPRVLAEIDL